MNNYIKIKDVKKYYKSSSHKDWVKALDGIDLEIKEGEILGLIGESGCGKSTLGKLLVGIEKPTDGEILFDDENQLDILKKDRKMFYKNVQMIFQNPYDVFDNRFTIERIFERILKNYKLGESANERNKIMEEALENASLYPAKDYLCRLPRELSGGQLQRIAIMRSMLLQPKFLVADEPITMLDVSVRSEIIKLLLKMTNENNTSILFISHDIATTSYISDRIAIMYLGQIVEEASTDEIINNPCHPYTKALLSNVVSLTEKNDERISLKGDPPSPIGINNKCYFSDRCYMAKERCFKECPQLIDEEGNHKVRCFYYK